MTENSNKNKQALENSINKLLEIVDDRSILACYLFSSLSKNTNCENTSQFKLVKNFNSGRVNDLLIHKTRPVTFYYILLTFHDTSEEFELQRDF